MKKPYKVLNLYAGIGGNRKLWTDCEVTAVEINPEIAKVYQDFFPNDKVITCDAHQYLLDHFKEFDFIWSSPPCQSHTVMSVINHKRAHQFRYPDMSLYQEIIFLRTYFKGKWIVENVKPYYKPLITAQKVDRHLIWSNFIVPDYKIKRLKNFIDANYTDLQKWLGIELKEKIYLGNNHCHKQVLRNCMHPNLGKYIFNRARNIQIEENTPQGKLIF